MQDIEQSEHPFGRSWWVQPGQLLGGCYPGDLDSAKAREKLAALAKVGVRQILCLQPEGELGRSGQPFAPYRDLWQDLAVELSLKLSWQRFGIPDMGVTTPENISSILAAIDGEPGVTYLHCWGGHGRTGTVAGCWLVKHGLSAEQAFDVIRQAREHNAHLRSNPSPQTGEQRGQVAAFGS